MLRMSSLFYAIIERKNNKGRRRRLRAVFFEKVSHRIGWRRGMNWIPFENTNLGSNNTKRVFFRAKKLKKRAAKKKRRTKRRVPRTCASSTNLALPYPAVIAIVVQSSVFVGEIGRKMRTKIEEKMDPDFYV